MYVHWFFVPEQTGALSMHQSGQSAGDCPRENTGWGMMDALLTTQGRHRLRSARRSDLLVVRLFIATEELKKMDWEEQGGLWNGFPGGPCRVQGSAWEEGLCTGSRLPVTQRGKGWELSVGNLCRVKSRGLGKCWLLQSAEWIWAKMQKKRCFVGCVTHLWRFLLVYDFGGASPDMLVVCAVPGSEAEGKRQRLSGSRLCVTLWRWMRCTPAGIPAPLTAVRADSQRTATEGGKILDVGSCPFGFCAEYWGQH